MRIALLDNSFIKNNFIKGNGTYEITYYTENIHFYNCVRVKWDFYASPAIPGKVENFTWKNFISVDRAPYLSKVRSHLALGGLARFACRVELFLIRNYNEAGRLVQTVP
jgi:hypothetical protein